MQHSRSRTLKTYYARIFCGIWIEYNIDILHYYVWDALCEYETQIITTTALKWSHLHLFGGAAHIRVYCQWLTVQIGRRCLAHRTRAVILSHWPFFHLNMPVGSLAHNEFYSLTIKRNIESNMGMRVHIDAVFNESDQQSKLIVIVLMQAL